MTDRLPVLGSVSLIREALRGVGNDNITLAFVHYLGEVRGFTVERLTPRDYRTLIELSADIYDTVVGGDWFGTTSADETHQQAEVLRAISRRIL